MNEFLFLEVINAAFKYHIKYILIIKNVNLLYAYFYFISIQNIVLNLWINFASFYKLIHSIIISLLSNEKKKFDSVYLLTYFMKSYDFILGYFYVFSE